MNDCALHALLYWVLRHCNTFCMHVASQHQSATECRAALALFLRSGGSTSGQAQFMALSGTLVLNSNLIILKR
jgi:hypothetical protein